MPRRFNSDDAVAGRAGRRNCGDLQALALSLLVIVSEAENTDECLQRAIDCICLFDRCDVGHAFVDCGDDSGKLRSGDIWNSSLTPEFDSFRRRTSVVSFRSGEGLVGRAADSRSAVCIEEYADAHLARSQAAGECGLISAFAIPVITQAGRIAAVIEFFTRERRVPSAPFIETLSTAATHIGRVFDRADRAAELAERLTLLEILAHHDTIVRHVDQSIADNSTLSGTLDLICDKLIAVLGVSDAHVLLCGADDHHVELMPTVSPTVPAIDLPSLRTRNDPARLAALDIEPVHIYNVANLEPHEALPEYMVHAGIRSYHAIPLVVDGELGGVLEICDRSPRHHDAKWSKLLTTLASQAATALRSARAFNGIQRENDELNDGIDRLLMQRAELTEVQANEQPGHARRLAALAVAMATALELPADEVRNIYRGSLLHNIGASLPPNELAWSQEQKRSVATEPERHNSRADAALADIPILQPALSIPTAYRDSFDGSEGSLGIEGADIPIAARIFAVVHRYDDLVSEPPQGQGLATNDAARLLQGFAGTHLDPVLVNLFLSIHETICGSDSCEIALVDSPEPDDLRFDRAA